jgi:hypothetical protein
VLIDEVHGRSLAAAAPAIPPIIPCWWWNPACVAPTYAPTTGSPVTVLPSTLVTSSDGIANDDHNNNNNNWWWWWNNNPTCAPSVKPSTAPTANPPPPPPPPLPPTFPPTTSPSPTTVVPTESPTTDQPTTGFPSFSPSVAPTTPTPSSISPSTEVPTSASPSTVPTIIIPTVDTPAPTVPCTDDNDCVLKNSTKPCCCVNDVTGLPFCTEQTGESCSATCSAENCKKVGEAGGFSYCHCIKSCSGSDCNNRGGNPCHGNGVCCCATQLSPEPTYGDACTSCDEDCAPGKQCEPHSVCDIPLVWGM